MAEYVENPRRTLLHDARVWISGAEVTDRLTSSVSIEHSGRGGHNTASFTLSNAGDGFILSQENTEGVFKVEGAAGDHSEFIKWLLWQFKHNDTINPVDPNTGERRWPLAAGKPVLHAMDPVFIASRWPYTEETRWKPEFKGYIDSKPFNENFVTGTSHVQVSCFDIRALMAYMRVQINYLITAETGAVSAEGVGRNSGAEDMLNAYDPVIIGDLFEDLQLPTTGSTPFADMTLEETIRLLITGIRLADPKFSDGGKVVKNPGFLDNLFTTLGGVFDPSSGVTDPADRKIAGLTVSRAGVKGDRTIDVKGIGRFKNDLGTVQWPSGTGMDADDKAILSGWHDMCLFGLENAGEPWTDEQVQAHAADCTWEGDNAPHSAQLFMMMPSEGSGMRGLVEYTFDAGSSSRTWQTRLSVITDMLEQLDYHWAVTGSGDIVVEPPLYDLRPEQFGKWADGLTFSPTGEMKTWSFEDDKSTVPSFVSATGAYSPNGTLQSEAMLTGDGLSLTNTRVSLYAPQIAARFGARVERTSFPFVVDLCRLQQFATLFFQRKLAEGSVMNLEFVYRPCLFPNRPVWITEKRRMGWVSSVTSTISRRKEHGIPSTSVNVQYIRYEDVDGNYMLLTGSANMPLSYNGSGPSITPARGIVVTESFQPGGAAESRNTTCEGVTGAPNPFSENALGTPNGVVTSPGTLADAPSTCSTSADDLANEVQSLFVMLQNQAQNDHNLSVELVCTYNSGDPHESMSPYLHGQKPARAFDIKLIRPDGSDATESDYRIVGGIGLDLGLVWGGAAAGNPSDRNLSEVQRKVLERARFHVDRGTPYVWGGDYRSVEALDCSGFVVECYIYAGLFAEGAEYGASALRAAFPEPQGRDPLPGELCFYRSPNAEAGKLATHVTILSEDGGCYTEGGPGSGPRMTTIASAKLYGAKATKKGRYNYRDDFIGFGAVFDVISGTVGNLNHFELP